MDGDGDPFRHHPELRGRIVDPATSYFRTFTVAHMEQAARERGLPVGWWYAEAEREALRRADLARRPAGDLHVFAYGSLMWDPALRFAEVRRAFAPHHARRFILKDVNGARGTAEFPGLMAALDDGDGCEGLVFRISEPHVEAETEILYRRERIGPAYRADFLPVSLTDGGRVTAIAFVADHSAPSIDATLSAADEVRLVATGHGFVGSSLDYVRNIEAKLDEMGIVDPHVTDLRRAAEAYRAANSG